MVKVTTAEKSRGPRNVWLNSWIFFTLDNILFSLLTKNCILLRFMRAGHYFDSVSLDVSVTLSSVVPLSLVLW